MTGICFSDLESAFPDTTTLLTLPDITYFSLPELILRENR